MNTSDDPCLVIFAKTARPGKVKTRLIGELSAQQAAELHTAFVGDLVDEMTAGGFSLRVAWATESGEAIPEIAAAGMVQPSGDLGERLYRVLAQLATSHGLVAAVGSDHPDLVVSLVQEAFDKLQRGADVVLGPAADGGYYLVGVRGEVLTPRIFERIPWSTKEVFQRTMDRCLELGLDVDLLAQGRDVDTPSDLEKLIVKLERDPVPSCSRTRLLLRSWGRLTRPESGG